MTARRRRTRRVCSSRQAPRPDQRSSDSLRRDHGDGGSGSQSGADAQAGRWARADAFAAETAPSAGDAPSASSATRETLPTFSAEGVDRNRFIPYRSGPLSMGLAERRGLTSSAQRPTI